MAIAHSILKADREPIFGCRLPTKRRLKVAMKRDYRAANTIVRERRTAIEQRRFSYAVFIPERRSGERRRKAGSRARFSDPSPVRSIRTIHLSAGNADGHSPYTAAVE
jgi:hypothetical protein